MLGDSSKGPVVHKIVIFGEGLNRLETLFGNKAPTKTHSSDRGCKRAPGWFELHSGSPKVLDSVYPIGPAPTTMG
jgi:hypothetical protein